MKLFSTLGLLLCIGICGFSQPAIQASLAPGSQANRVKILLKPAATVNNATISTLQFNVGVSTTITPKPNLTVVSTTISGMTANQWQIVESTEGGFYNYSILTAVSPITLNATVNTEFEVMEVQFSGGPATSNNVALVTLPDGGAANGNALFLSTGALRSIGSSLYYTRAGVTVNNQFSYDENNVNPGTTTSTATIGGVILPVNWLKFTVLRQGNDVALTWDVNNELNTDKYQVEVGTNGTDFTALATQPKTTGSGTKTYSYLDKKVARYNAKVLYYRIKQFDVDGKFTYSPTKTVRLDVRGETSLFPNPAKEGFTLTIPYLNPDQKRIQLHLVNSLGQIVERKDITRQAAMNYYYNLQSSLIVSGDYLLKIYEDGELTETKRVIVKK